MKFKIEPKFVNDYLYSQFQKKKEIQNRKRKMRIENEIEIESRPLLKEVRNSLIKWGVIIKRPRIQSISIGRRKGTLYYLNRMFPPIFGISFRTRGGYNFVMPTALFESLLKESWEPEKIKNWKEKTQKNAHLPSVKSISSENCVDPNQMSMFEV